MKSILWFAIAALVGSYICLQVADPDLWWHITVGNWIVSHRAVPHVDLWNMFSGGMPWRAYSWSTEVLFALVNASAGPTGLLLLQLAFAIILALVLQRVFMVLAADSFVGAMIGVYSTVACFNHFTLRPQVIVWILFALAIMVADEGRVKALTKRSLASLGLIGVVWANCHLTAILGLVAIFLWSVQQNARSALSWKRALASSLAFFAGTLVTPYVGGEWLTFLSKGGHPLKFQSIAEFQPSTILQYSTVFIVLYVVLLVVATYQSRVVPTLARAILAGGLTLAGLTAVKFLPFAAISLGALLAVWWRDIQEARAVSGDNRLADGMMQAKQGFERLAPSTIGALAIFLLCIATVNVTGLLRHPLNNAVVPKDAVDFFEQHQLHHPVLNEFGSGGYLMYRFSNPDGTPRYQVPIDGRTNVNSQEIWEMYQASLRGTTKWAEYIDKVNPKTILWRQGSPFVSLLLLSPEWCRVYASGQSENDFVLFITRDEYARRSSELSSIDCAA
jgi:hypothetical protein